jgi:hypothetical protein
MGLSLSRIYSSLSSLAFWGKDKEVRILMVGLDSAGKVRQQRLSLRWSRLCHRPCCPRRAPLLLV